MYYVNKEDFDDVFNLKENINNEFLKIETYNEYFYSVYVNEKLYERFKKILKMAYHPGIDKYIKIIKYTKKNKKDFNHVLEITGVNEISKTIDKEIIENLFKLKNNKNDN